MAGLKKTIIDSEELSEELAEMRHDYSLGRIAELCSNMTTLLESLKSTDNSAELKSVIEKLASIKIDMSPIIRIAAEITSNNKTILDKVVALAKPESNEAKYHELLKMTLETIKQNNEFIQKMMKTPEITIGADSETPKEWDFKIIRGDGGEMRSITAKAK